MLLSIDPDGPVAIHQQVRDSKAGDPAAVTMPDGSTTDGVIASVGTVASGAGSVVVGRVSGLALAGQVRRVFGGRGPACYRLAGLDSPMASGYLYT